MVKTLVGRYLLFSILGIETLLLPYFLSKDVYGEVEFLKFTVFLAQFALFGSGTGYVVRFLEPKTSNKVLLTQDFIIMSFLHGLIIGGIIFIFKSWVLAILTILAIIAISFESIIKVREKYLLAMSFKPILSSILICTLPFMLIYNWNVEKYLLTAFIIATAIFIIVIFRCIGKELLNISTFRMNIKDYFQNISAGFMINISTAMLFSFFYIDRAIVRNVFPERLGDYSLSYAIMQLTIVAITTFSYVNLVEFGKEQSDLTLFKNKVFKAFRQCFVLYIVIGTCSIIFSYGAEKFYNYEAVFETTTLMVGLFGFANVMSSLNAAHLYLGTINKMAILMLGFFILSIILNFTISYSTPESYYLLLGKTYGLYLLFSLVSCLYISFKLHFVVKNTEV
ncbi:hypothetical protein N8742_00660 [Emcibacteraceae bacterium]|nr:hypothetical protein [Emcibacteraceae bacterium]